MTGIRRNVITCWASCSGICKLTGKTPKHTYFTLVRPNSEYCSTVSSPFTSHAKHKIEIVQRRVARYATNIYHNTSSAIDSQENLNWETLETGRIKPQLTMLFKIMRCLVDIPAENYHTPASTRTRFLHTKKLKQYTSSTDALKVQLLSMYHYHLGRNPGGYSHFFCIRRLGPSICPSPQKNIRNFKHPKKIFEILATQKNIPNSVP